MHDLTISIGTIANIDGLEECLRTVFAEDDPDFKFEVNLIFNGPQEESRIEQFKTLFPQVHIIRSRHKLGWPRTHNQTLKKYDSRYVLLLDDDTLLPKGTLPTMLRFMDAHSEVGIAGCETSYPDGSFQKIYGLFLNLKTELLYALNLPSYWPDRLYRNITSWKEVEWLNGHFMLVRSEVLQTVGLLDEYYYTYVSEPDWCYRIHQAGWKVAYVPDAKIIHVGGENSTRTLYKKYTQIIRSYVNRYYFFSKYYSRFAFHCLRPITMIGAFLRLLKFLLVYTMVPARKAEAEQKIKAFLIVIQMAFSRNPSALPKYLQKENDLAEKGL